MTYGNDVAFSRSGSAISPSDYDIGADGCSKREYFAALAMQGILAAQTDENGYGPVWRKDQQGHVVRDGHGRPVAAITLETVIARVAVKQADALIDALNEEKENGDSSNS